MAEGARTAGAERQQGQARTFTAEALLTAIYAVVPRSEQWPLDRRRDALIAALDVERAPFEERVRADEASKERARIVAFLDSEDPSTDWDGWLADLSVRHDQEDGSSGPAAGEQLSELERVRREAAEEQRKRDVEDR
jgi:hypothetical protein